jgi:hypothetical protein|tara:strand:+ start:970 stop:1236 length:267 start_codon:yes stop_codon:yes gene_type:complete
MQGKTTYSTRCWIDGKPGVVNVDWNTRDQAFDECVLAMRGTAFVPTDLVQCIQIIATDSLGSERVIDRWEQADNRAFTHSIRDGVVLL